jgi:hypothetical protein
MEHGAAERITPSKQRGTTSFRRDQTLNQMCKTVPPEGSWSATNAAKWDQMTWAKWSGEHAAAEVVEREAVVLA